MIRSATLSMMFDGDEPMVARVVQAMATSVDLSASRKPLPAFAGPGSGAIQIAQATNKPEDVVAYAENKVLYLRQKAERIRQNANREPQSLFTKFLEDNVGIASDFSLLVKNIAGKTAEYYESDARNIARHARAARQKLSDIKATENDSNYWTGWSKEGRLAVLRLNLSGLLDNINKSMPKQTDQDYYWTKIKEAVRDSVSAAYVNAVVTTVGNFLNPFK